MAGRSTLTREEYARDTLAWAQAIRANPSHPTLVYQLADELIHLLSQDDDGDDLPSIAAMEVYPQERSPS